MTETSETRFRRLLETETVQQLWDRLTELESPQFMARLFIGGIRQRLASYRHALYYHHTVEGVPLPKKQLYIHLWKIEILWDNFVQKANGKSLDRSSTHSFMIAFCELRDKTQKYGVTPTPENLNSLIRSSLVMDIKAEMLAKGSWSHLLYGDQPWYQECEGTERMPCPTPTTSQREPPVPLIPDIHPSKNWDFSAGKPTPQAFARRFIGQMLMYMERFRLILVFWSDKEVINETVLLDYCKKIENSWIGFETILADLVHGHHTIDFRTFRKNRKLCNDLEQRTEELCSNTDPAMEANLINRVGRPVKNLQLMVHRSKPIWNPYMLSDKPDLLESSSGTAPASPPAPSASEEYAPYQEPFTPSASASQTDSSTHSDSAPQAEAPTMSVTLQLVELRNFDPAIGQVVFSMPETPVNVQVFTEPINMVDQENLQKFIVEMDKFDPAQGHVVIDLPPIQMQTSNASQPPESPRSGFAYQTCPPPQDPDVSEPQQPPNSQGYDILSDQEYVVMPDQGYNGTPAQGYGAAQAFAQVSDQVASMPPSFPVSQPQQATYYMPPHQVPQQQAYYMPPGRSQQQEGYYSVPNQGHQQGGYYNAYGQGSPQGGYYAAPSQRSQQGAYHMAPGQGSYSTPPGQGGYYMGPYQGPIQRDYQDPHQRFYYMPPR